MDNSIYKHYKEQLKEIARTEKRHNPNDRPRVRQVINDSLNDIINGLEWHQMREKISEAQKNIYCKWLENLAIKLHP